MSKPANEDKYGTFIISAMLLLIVLNVSIAFGEFVPFFVPKEITIPVLFFCGAACLLYRSVRARELCQNRIKELEESMPKPAKFQDITS